MRVRAGRLPPPVDLLLTAAVLTLTVAGVVATPAQPGFRSPDAVVVLLAVAQGLPLVVRRRFPGRVLLAVWAATEAYFLLGYPPATTALLAAVVATYTVGAYAASRVTWACTVFSAVMLGLLIAYAANFWPGMSPAEGVALFLVFLIAWVLGDRMRARRAYTVALEDRARQLERERERDAEAAAAAERTRIARELHDVVAHGVSVIVLHARAAQEVMRADPAAAQRSLQLIEDTGRQALTELRTVLGALRTDDSDRDERQPLPGLADLDRLVSEVREAGLSVELTTEGQPRPLPPGVAVSAYRIVQEALTNTLKHSTADKARVVLRYGHDRLLVQVSDDGAPRRPATEPGHGLVGMRERVALFGGRLQVGPRGDGGFDVLAVLPIPRSQQ
jgi:signal transduction histidine kinase